MKLYIQVENGQPVNHPALENNLMQTFNEIPTNWEAFDRPERPSPTPYQVIDAQLGSYVKLNGVWTDVWSIRDMTAEEKAAKQQAVRDEFNARDQAENWSAWVLDESTCMMQPPIPRPEPDQAKLTQGIMTFWCGADVNWKDTPVRPEGKYKFDFIAWAWVAA